MTTSGEVTVDVRMGVTLIRNSRGKVIERIFHDNPRAVLVAIEQVGVSDNVPDEVDTPWQPLCPANRTTHPLEVGETVWVNDRYVVTRHVTPNQDARWLSEYGPVSDPPPAIVHLSIRRTDRQAIHDWRHLQKIKNELIGRENEAIELYPAESRLVDEANQFHLFGFADPTLRWPVGMTYRAVVGANVRIPGAEKSQQRPFVDGEDADTGVFTPEILELVSRDPNVVAKVLAARKASQEPHD